MFSRLIEMGTRLLLVPRIRYVFVKNRWRRRRHLLRSYADPTAAVGSDVVSYNLTAFDSASAFGCGGRMDLVMYPLAALAPKSSRVLIVGPRTEDDIYLAKALGFSDTRGLDLFTYSPHIDLGDMHAPPYPAASFDAVVLGWVVAYSDDPRLALKKAMDLVRPGGFLAIGWEWVPAEKRVKSPNLVGQPVVDVKDYCEVVPWAYVFLNDPETPTNHHKSIIFRKPT